MQSTRNELEDLLEIGIWMEGIRDGDRILSMRQKFFGVMVIAKREYYATELAEAVQYKKTRRAEARAKSIEEDEYVPEP